jgi:predicted MFS family arabinose efflux permease
VQRQLGWSEEQWLALEGGQAVWFGLAGSLLGGLLASSIGAKRTVILSMASMSLCWFAYAFWAASWGDTQVVRILFLAETALAGFLQVSMFALFMGLCWPPVAATQFTTYMALLNVSYTLGANLADDFEKNFTMSGAHVVLGCLQIALIAIVLAIDPSETRRKLGDAQTAPSAERPSGEPNGGPNP